MEYYLPMILAIGANQTNEAMAPAVHATPTEPRVWLVILVAIGTLAVIYGLKALLMLIIEAGDR